MISIKSLCQNFLRTVEVNVFNWISTNTKLLLSFFKFRHVRIYRNILFFWSLRKYYAFYSWKGTFAIDYHHERISTSSTNFANFEGVIVPFKFLACLSLVQWLKYQQSVKLRFKPRRLQLMWSLSKHIKLLLSQTCWIIIDEIFALVCRYKIGKILSLSFHGKKLYINFRLNVIVTSFNLSNSF